jgi:multidrug efflux pump subunit AcrA (membrane-fusion protein)
MAKIFKKLAIVAGVIILLVSGISCASKTAPSQVGTKVVTVQPGNLIVSVSVDGNLVMPQAFDLRFGAPGNVKDVLVEEGDFVKAGQILATLDDTAQRLDIQSSNNNVQTVLSNLYETVPRLPQFPNKTYESNTTTTTDTVWERVPLWDPDLPHLPIIDPVTSQQAWGYIPKTVTTTETTLTATEDLFSNVSWPDYYPNATALASFAWAQDEVVRARDLFKTDNYTAAASELYVALSDLDSCTKIFEDAINNPKSGLGNMAPFVSNDLAGITYQSVIQDQPFEIYYIVELRKAIDLIKQGQTDIEKVRELTVQGKYDEADQMFNALSKRVDKIGKAVVNNVNVIRAHNFSTVYGEDISLYFYGAAEEKLNEALKGIESGGLDSPELHDNLRIARHYMEICNAILGSNDYVLQHGLSLQDEQQYKVDLAKALVDLGNKKDDFLKTVILAPFDGTVVSVGVKKNDVLSAMDYSSNTAVQLVDTSQIKFQGSVDEIDILKIKTGQKAMISVDAIPDKIFTGTVSFISPYGTADTSNVVKFNVTIQLDPTDVELKGGLTSTADIAISNVSNVLLVPLSAVTTTTAGSFVTVTNLATGQTEKRKVTLGTQNLQFAEVLSGLEEGDKVIVEEKAVGAPVVTTPPRPTGGPPPGR